MTETELLVYCIMHRKTRGSREQKQIRCWTKTFVLILLLSFCTHLQEVLPLLGDSRRSMNLYYTNTFQYILKHSFHLLCCWYMWIYLMSCGRNDSTIHSLLNSYIFICHFKIHFLDFHFFLRFLVFPTCSWWRLT